MYVQKKLSIKLGFIIHVDFRCFHDNRKYPPLVFIFYFSVFIFHALDLWIVNNFDVQQVAKLLATMCALSYTIFDHDKHSLLSSCRDLEYFTPKWASFFHQASLVCLCNPIMYMQPIFMSTLSVEFSTQY